jgi:hypothetical protein
MKMPKNNSATIFCQFPYRVDGFSRQVALLNCYNIMLEQESFQTLGLAPCSRQVSGKGRPCIPTTRTQSGVYERVGRLRCGGKNGLAEFWNIHLYPTTDSARVASLNKIQNDMHARAFAVMLGDFNFVSYNDDRIYHDCSSPISQTDNKFAEYWGEHYHDMRDISQSVSMTQFSPTHSALLDRIYVSSKLAPQSLFEHTSWIVPGFRDLSDHVPVSATLRPQRHEKRKCIPERIITHPLFKQHVEERWAEAELINMSPWRKLAFLKSCFWKAAKHVRIHGKTETETVEDNLRHAALFFRAVVDGNPETAAKCITQFHRLQSCYETNASGMSLTPLFFDLWRDLTTRQELSAPTDGPIADKTIETNKTKGTRSQKSASTIVSGLKQQENAKLDAVWDGITGKPCFDRSEKVDLLNAHWEKVFSPKPFSQEAYDSSMKDYRCTFPSIDWTLDLIYLENWLRKPKKSSPGPDGIPFVAFSAVLTISKLVLGECAKDLLDGGDPPDDFNFATLVLLPKKPSVEVDGTMWYAPKDTRPISIVNTDNRLIANVFRNTLTNFADKTCAPEQRGFLTKRYLLENVVDVDIEARRMYLKGRDGTLILIDLTAAFPSLGREYMFRTLKTQGVPDSFINAIGKLYTNNKNFIKLDGKTSEAFTVKSGVRQGCPLSPVLFALALDPFLCYLRHSCPQETMIKAYADDMAVISKVIENIYTKSDGVFSHFGKRLLH